MGIEQNRANAIRLIEAIGQGRLERSLMAPDATWWTNNAKGESALDEFEAIITAFMARRIDQGGQTIRATTAEGNRVALETEGHSVYEGGHVYNNRYHFLVRFRDDGLIDHVREYYDSAYTRDFLARLNG